MTTSSSSEENDDIDLSTTVAGIRLESCIYNASGPRSGTAAALGNIQKRYGAGAILTKSATLTSQPGNPLPRTWHAPDNRASLNSEGLPNNGIEYYISQEVLQEVYASVGDEDGNSSNSSSNRKPYMVSLSGKTLKDNLEMMQRIADAPTLPQIAAIELNLACPNVIGKPIIGYDFDQMKEILQNVSEFYDTYSEFQAKKSPSKQQQQQQSLPPLGIKLPPYFDFQHFATVASVINDYKKVVQFVVTINTLGNAFAVDAISETPVISSNAGFAGLSGPAVKYTALANVYKLRQLLHKDIDVVGVGGVETGHDVYEMLLAGASAVQVATCHWKEGPVCFDRMHNELVQLMKQRNYTSIQKHVIGQLKEWSKEGAAKSRDHQQAEKKATAAAAAAKTTAMDQQQKGGAPVDSDINFYKALCAVLVLLVAALCADKWAATKLLPSE